MTPSGLTPIHPLTLVPNHCVGTNVYIWNDKTNSTIKLLSSEQVVTETTSNFLLANPSLQVYVANTCHQSYREYLCEQLEASLAKPRIPKILKTAVLAESIRVKLQDAFAQGSVQKMLVVIDECGQQMAKLGHQIHLNGREVQRTLQHDSSFVTHALNTAFYAFLIADHQGYCEDMVSQICAGAMLHDIGKMDLESLETHPAHALKTPSDWTLRRTKSHPTDGFRLLCREPGVTETQLMITYQHHERPDGKGFPVGLLGDEIHVGSRICAVANRYDGLTSDRPHRPELTRLAAMRVLDSEKNTALDSEVLKCLEQVMSQTTSN